MVVVYGQRTVFKREGIVGTAVCNNCGHNVLHTLCRQVNQTTLFWIPIVSIERQRGIMCESCGNIMPISKQEYKDRRNAAKENAKALPK